MEFVEDHHRHPFQGRIGLQQAQEHPRGEHQQSGVGALARLQTNAVAHPLPHRLPEGPGQPLGGGSGRQATGLDQQEAGARFRLSQQDEGNPGCFARPRGSLQQQGGALRGHGLPNRGQPGVDRQGLPPPRGLSARDGCHRPGDRPRPCSPQTPWRAGPSQTWSAGLP